MENRKPISPRQKYIYEKVITAIPRVKGVDKFVPGTGVDFLDNPEFSGTFLRGVDGFIKQVLILIKQNQEKGDLRIGIKNYLKAFANKRPKIIREITRSVDIPKPELISRVIHTLELADRLKKTHVINLEAADKILPPKKSEDSVRDPAFSVWTPQTFKMLENIPNLILSALQKPEGLIEKVEITQKWRTEVEGSGKIAVKGKAKEFIISPENGGEYETWDLVIKMNANALKISLEEQIKDLENYFLEKMNGEKEKLFSYFGFKNEEDVENFLGELRQRNTPFAGLKIYVDKGGRKVKAVDHINVVVQLNPRNVHDSTQIYSLYPMEFLDNSSAERQRVGERSKERLAELRRLGKD